jgi:hypothetical protein
VLIVVVSQRIHGLGRGGYIMIDCMDDETLIGRLSAADVDATQPPADVVEKLCHLGLIERENGRWKITDLGRAALESLEAIKQ